jgi:hypothetical protein
MSEDAGAVAVPGRVDERSQRTSVRAFVRTHGLLLSAATWLLLVLNFTGLQFGSTDELVQYGFVRRIFGDSDQHSAYLVGLALLEAPFYALGKLVDALGLHHPGGRPATEATLVLAFGLLTLLLWPLLGSVMRGLDLAHRGSALLAAGLGTSLLYYATFQATKSHGMECVLFALALYLVFRLFHEEDAPRWLPFALGATLALVTGVRYLDAALGIALVVVLAAYRRIRQAVEVSIGGIVVGLVLLAVPLAMGASLGLTTAPQAGRTRTPHVPVGITPATPVKMLFSNERGLFLFSPIALLAVAGLVVLWRRRPVHRPFLVAVYAMALGVLLFQGTTPWYTGGFGFGQRYLTVLMPVVALGVAGVLLAWPRAGAALAVLCAGWTVFLLLNFVTIGVPRMTRGGVTELARVPRTRHISPGAYLWGVRYQSNLLHWTTR